MIPVLIAAAGLPAGCLIRAYIPIDRTLCFYVTASISYLSHIDKPDAPGYNEPKKYRQLVLQKGPIMSEFRSLEEAREYFSHDRFAAESGIVLEEISEGHAVASMELTFRHQNAQGGVMGGAIFTLMDLAFAAACSSIHRPTVAQQISINYLNSPKGTRLTAAANCKKDGRTSGVYQIEITDDLGRDIAFAVATAFKL